MKGLLPRLLEGFNVTMLSYGITGSGKTYTMLGSGFEGSNVQIKPKVQYIKGISLLAIEDLFDLLAAEQAKQPNTIDMKYSSSIEISYIEVYNEKVRDLLRNDEQNNLIILEEPSIGTVIPGLKKCKVNNVDEAVALILTGNERRTMAATVSNQFSSRSHAIIQV